MGFWRFTAYWSWTEGAAAPAPVGPSHVAGPIYGLEHPMQGLSKL